MSVENKRQQKSRSYIERSAYFPLYQYARRGEGATCKRDGSRLRECFCCQIGEDTTGGKFDKEPLDHIAGGEGVLREGRPEQFVDDAFSCDANWTLLHSGGMGGHDHAAGVPSDPTG